MHVSDLCQEDRDIARISAVDRGAYRIRNQTREVPAELAGKFYFQVDASIDLPCVGDWVTVQYHNNDAAAIIHEVFPRKTFLHRKSAGEKVDLQMIAANIDVAFIVQSCHFDFNVRRMDRSPSPQRGNGAGKSNFIDFFRMLRAMMELPLPGLSSACLKTYIADGGGSDDFLLAHCGLT